MRCGKKLIVFNLILMTIVQGFFGCSLDTHKENDESNIQKIKVALWDYEVTGYDKKLIEKFSEEYPNIKVEVISFSGDQYDKKLDLTLESRSDIDVFFAETENQLVKLSLNNHIRTIDDLIARDKINLDFYNGIARVNNKIYGLPYRSDLQVLYYNKDIFDKNKMPYPTNDMTWEEYRDVGRKLTTKNGENPIYGIFLLSNCLEPKTNNGEKFDLLKSNLNMLKPGIELIMNIEMVDKSAVEYGINKSLNANQLTFEKGDTAMFINGTWFANYLVKDKKNGDFDFNWGVVKSPHWDDENKSDNIMITPVCINAKTTKLEAAWTFEKFIAGQDGAEIMAKEIMLPGYISYNILSEFNMASGLPKSSEMVFETNKIINYDAFSESKYLISKIVMEEVNNILMKKKSIDQGISDMMKRREKILNLNGGS